MTERLGTLLRGEAASIPVPPLDADGVLRRGRRMRRRRRGAELVAATTVVAAVAVAASLAISDEHRTVSPAESTAYRHLGAFSVGQVVHVGSHRVELPDRIQALYYTSEGVLVRHGASADGDESKTTNYTLVRPNGSAQDLPLLLPDRIPGTNPDSPNLGYATRDGDRWSLVVVDLRDGGDEITRVTLDGPFTWAGWEAPPVSLSGDRIWALFDRGWVEFNWRTGETRAIPGTQGDSIDAAGGRYAEYDDATVSDWVVKDFSTGDQVTSIPRTATRHPFEFAENGELSPDGRFVRLSREGAMYNSDNELISPPGPSRFVDLATGSSVAIPGKRFYGWTPDGDVFAVDTEKDQVMRCDPMTGHCSKSSVPLGTGKVKLGGTWYGS